MSWDGELDRQAVRAALQQRRLEDRERQALWERLRWCQLQLLMRSSTTAVALETKTSSQHPESSPPPGVNLAKLTKGSESAAGELLETGLGMIDHLVRPILNAIVDLERGLDFDQGLSGGRDTTTMIGSEKDTELRVRWEGIHSSVVSRQAPHLGSQSTVERARARMGLARVSGLPRVQKDVAA